MKFEFQVREVGKEPVFTETFDRVEVETAEQAQAYCEQVITNFNSHHLYKDEADRELIPGSVKIIGPSDPIDDEDDEDDEDLDDDEDEDEDEEDWEDEEED